MRTCPVTLFHTSQILLLALQFLKPFHVIAMMPHEITGLWAQLKGNDNTGTLDTAIQLFYV